MLAEIPDYFIFSIISLIVFVPFGLVAMDKTLEVCFILSNASPGKL